MLMGFLCLQVDSICLGHTLAPQKSPLICEVLPILVISDLCLLDLKFSEMLNNSPISILIHRSCDLVYLNGVVAPKLHFCKYLFMK